jgi:hypothetical protein
MNLGLLTVLAGLLTAAPLAPQQAHRLQLRVARAANIRLDGLLDEPEWATADSITDLTAVEPDEGGRPVGRTVVRLLAERGALVIAVHAYDPLTVNTDFAETDADTRRTNLTRFPLFFPEKRSFFLEGADIFQFGLGLGQDVLPFHSRRIGLRSGREVPIDIGTKVNGRLGSTNLGALVVNTFDLNLERNIGDLPEGDFVQQVIGTRVRFNIFAQSQPEQLLAVRR